MTGRHTVNVLQKCVTHDWFLQPLWSLRVLNTFFIYRNFNNLIFVRQVHKNVLCLSISLSLFPFSSSHPSDLPECTQRDVSLFSQIKMCISDRSERERPNIGAVIQELQCNDPDKSAFPSATVNPIDLILFWRRSLIKVSLFKSNEKCQLNFKSHLSQQVTLYKYKSHLYLLVSSVNYVFLYANVAEAEPLKIL